MLKTVKTENGYVRGIPAADPRVISFKGIPFAAPPVGDLRWRAPQPAKDWEGVRDCLEFAPISMQSIPGLNEENIYTREWNVDPTIPMNEDCLYLNVWTPAVSETDKLSVYVWYFGGGLQWGNPAEMEFDGEGQLTSAVNYVTGDVSKKIYRTAGHGEATLSATVSDLMDKNNYTLSELNLLMNPEIPEDCDLLLMYAPAKDLTEEEKTAVETYLSGGGNVMILLGDTNATELPNLSALMKTYGLEAADGYIADPQRAYQGNYYYFFPMLSASGDLANGLTSEMVLLANAHGLNLTAAARDTITTEAFMETSQNAFAVTEESQSEGSYTLGATATEALDDEKESRLTVISAGSLIDAQITDTFTTLENTTLFMNVVTANFDDVENVSVEPKSLAVEYNTVQYPGILSLFVIFGIPIMVLAAGFVVWFRRRRA